MMFNSLYESLLESLTSRADYGSWLGPDGTIHPVKDQMAHARVAMDILDKKQIDHDISVYTTSSPRAVYADMFALGFIRIVNKPLAIESPLKVITSKQRLALSTLLRYPSPVFTINNEVADTRLEASRILRGIPIVTLDEILKRGEKWEKQNGWLWGKST